LQHCDTATLGPHPAIHAPPARQVNLGVSTASPEGLAPVRGNPTAPFAQMAHFRTPLLSNGCSRMFSQQRSDCCYRTPGSTNCTSCTLGTWSPQGSGVCTLCIAGKLGYLWHRLLVRILDGYKRMVAFSALRLRVRKALHVPSVQMGLHPQLAVRPASPVRLANIPMLPQVFFAAIAHPAVHRTWLPSWSLQ